MPAIGGQIVAFDWSLTDKQRVPRDLAAAFFGRRPAAIAVKSTPARRLTIIFTAHILLFGLAAVAHHGRQTIRIFGGCSKQKLIFAVDLLFVGQQFCDQRCSGLTVTGEQETLKIPRNGEIMPSALPPTLACNLLIRLLGAVVCSLLYIHMLNKYK